MKLRTEYSVRHPLIGGGGCYVQIEVFFERTCTLQQKGG
jgi:hypothetical protein